MNAPIEITDSPEEDEIYSIPVFTISRGDYTTYLRELPPAEQQKRAKHLAPTSNAPASIAASFGGGPASFRNILDIMTLPFRKGMNDTVHHIAVEEVQDLYDWMRCTPVARVCRALKWNHLNYIDKIHAPRDLTSHVHTFISIIKRFLEIYAQKVPEWKAPEPAFELVVRAAGRERMLGRDLLVQSRQWGTEALEGKRQRLALKNLKWGIEQGLVAAGSDVVALEKTVEDLKRDLATKVAASEKTVEDLKQVWATKLTASERTVEDLNQEWATKLTASQKTVEDLKLHLATNMTTSQQTVEHLATEMAAMVKVVIDLKRGLMETHPTLFED